MEAQRERKPESISYKLAASPQGLWTSVWLLLHGLDKVHRRLPIQWVVHEYTVSSLW